MIRSSGAVLAAMLVLAAVAGAVVPAPAAAQEDCSFPASETDATGTEVTLEEEPETVVVTAPSAAQTIWELGEEDRVVGMPVGEMQGTDYLDGADERTHVMDGVNVDTEQVVDLDPDLVIAPNVTSEEDVVALRDLGLTVYSEGDASSIEDIRENVQTTGRLLGACEPAEETVDWMDQRLATVDEAVEGEDRPSVYYWLGEGYTAPESSFQNDLLERAGARNAAANMSVGDDWQLADEEQIVEEDPEYLLLQEGDEVPDNEAIQATTAVEEDNVIYVDRNHWNQDAPRVVLAVQEIAEQLHPEAFGADDESTAGADADGADDGLPGFGVVPALAALLAIVGALIRRS